MLNMKSCIFFPCPLVRGKLQGKHSLCAKVFARQLECTLIEFWRVLCEDLTVILLVKKYLSANQGKVLCISDGCCTEFNIFYFILYLF